MPINNAPLLGVRRVVNQLQPLPQVDDTQPNPGWGFICAHCKYTFDDSRKYVGYPPEFPCKRLQFSRGGYDSRMSYESPAPIFHLRRYVDGSESCPKYERADTDTGGSQQFDTTNVTNHRVREENHD